MQQPSKTKTSTKVAIISVIVALIAVAYGIGRQREINMMTYAQVNNCEWVFSSYIDRDPVCK